MTFDFAEMKNHQIFRPNHLKDYSPGSTWLLERIVTKLSFCENVILAAPHGWGKENFVRQAAFLLTEKNKDFQVCFLDLFNISTKEEFLIQFSDKILRLGNPQLRQKLQSIAQGDEILTLPHLISTRQKVKVLICIGNFQNITRFKDSLPLQKAIRAKWRSQSNCAFFFYGNRHQELTNLFRTPGSPLSRFGRLYTKKTSRIYEIETTIKKQFFDTDKRITPEAAKLIAVKANQHPFYTELLVRNSWFRTDYNCTVQIVNEVFTDLVLQFRYYFQYIIDNLTNKQLYYLKAVLDHAYKICSAYNLEHFQLGRSSNVARVRESLIRKEIIEVIGKEVIILDPLLEHWLVHSFFRTSHG